ncbi:MAG: hypothetical protein IJ705_01490, partial [Oscillospiraceae bacterium]|nr:hypothetical protein [Oscillospiraceae bacterium]
LFGPALPPPEVYNTWDLRVASEVPGLEEEAAYTARGHLITEKLDENGRRIVNEEEVNALREIIALCREIGATPVLIVTPLLAEYLAEAEKQAPEFFGEFDALVENIAADTGTAYFDYAADPRFTGSPRLFANSDHLNKAGAEVFTRIVMEEVVAPIWKEKT